jgi:hypothetical protein
MARGGGTVTHRDSIVAFQPEANVQSKRLVAQGADENHCKVPVAIGDDVLGVVQGTAIGEVWDYTQYHVDVELNPIIGDVESGAAVVVGNLLVTDATGCAIPLPGGAGTYWVFGKAITAAGGGAELVKFRPFRQRIVI